jgi:hypothetical protein
MSPHYVLVSDLRGIKMATLRGAPRPLSAHEFLHLYLQRAEQARSDFSKYFGEPREMRSAIVLVRSESTRQRFSQVMFGNPKTNLLYGGGSNKLLRGLAGNGFCLSGRDDDDLHFNTRHMIGHLAISTYHTTGIHEKHLPQWVFRGAAHWLCKLHPRAKDHAYFCSYEGVTVSGSGKKWESKARKIAARGPDRDPVERMLQAATAKQMNYDMHVRAWSWFDVFLEGERDHFVDFIRRLRAAEEPRLAAKAAFEQPPEMVDDRWRETVTGKRKKVDASEKERARESDVDEATSRELASIARETDLQLLASRIRGLDRCRNIRTARLLVSLLDSRRSDRVRTVIALVLGRTDDEEVRAFLRGKGYERAGRFGKATLCSVFGVTEDRDAVELLRAALQDSDWLVRANAAQSLARLKDAESIPELAKMAAGGSPGKSRIAAMDALAAFGAAAKETAPAFERNLMKRDWQIKIATCSAFRALGNTAVVDSLIGRLDMEGGRVHDEIRRALKSLTGVDKDWKADTWRKWWKTAKKFAEREKKMREELGEQDKTEPKKPDRRYATQKKPPTYYGITVYARAIAYVLDTSLSMEQGFRASKAWQERLGHELKGTSRMEVCKEELIHSITALDPRTRMNLVFFNDRVRKWKDAPTTVAAVRESAISTIRNVRPAGQTNYHGALEAILQIGDGRDGWESNFADTPDTLFFLTDGRPTDGEITKADELLAWWNERNRFARIRVHVIAMGTTGVDVEFLRRFATENDGTFVHMTGKH